MYSLGLTILAVAFGGNARAQDQPREKAARALATVATGPKAEFLEEIAYYEQWYVRLRGVRAHRKIRISDANADKPQNNVCAPDPAGLPIAYCADERRSAALDRTTKTSRETKSIETWREIPGRSASARDKYYCSMGKQQLPRLENQN
jgi:hypothetical protein